MTLRTDEFNENDSQDLLKQELIRKGSIYWNGFITIIGGLAATASYLSGSDDYVNPLTCSIVAGSALLSTRAGCSHASAMSCTIVFCILVVLNHALQQGCSASMIPTTYSIMPCMGCFLFRSKRAILFSLLGCLTAILCIFAIELSGNCSSDPIPPSDKGLIVAHRLIPSIATLLGISGALVGILEQSEESLRIQAESARSARKLAAMQKDVLHRVAHELRTPLNGMMGSVQLLTDSDTMTAYDMENARTIQSCLQNILRISDDILLAAKSQQKNKPKKETAFKLASCLDGVADTFAAAAAGKGIKLVVEFAGNTVSTLRGMEVELRQVLLNLVGNAIKFTKTGSVTMRVHEEPSASSPDLLKYQFEVEDTGIGISMEDAKMLFEPFYQVEKSVVSRKHKGTGLGLMICKNLVEHMGGEIAVDGELGRGTRFFFSLELKREPESGPPSLSDEQMHKKPLMDLSPRVLISDSQKASSSCCESLVKSLVPSAVVSKVQSNSSLMDLVAKEATSRPSTTECARVVFMGCDELGTDALVSSIRKLKNDGWFVFAYSDFGSFKNLVKNSRDASEVFRRPLPLVRMEDALREVLVPGSASTSGADKKAKEESLSKPSPIDDPKTRAETETQEPVTPVANASPTVNMMPKARVSRQKPIDLPPGSKIVVVDDTEVNLKVLVKILSRTLSASVPIVSCFGGQEAIDEVVSSNDDKHLLILMDWHMPVVCGLSATTSIRKHFQELRHGPTVHICMVSADADNESLYTEMNKRGITHLGVVSNGELVLKTSSRNGDEAVVSSLATPPEIPNDDRDLELDSNNSTTIDLVVKKPVTFKNVRTILTWFSSTVTQK